MSSSDLSRLLTRQDATTSTVHNPHGVDISLFANADVAIEREALDQVLELVSLASTLEELHERRFFGDVHAAIERVVLTPDLHRGSGIPVGTVLDARGFVIPRAIGNDVCCGMRLLATDLPADALEAHWPALASRLRGVFFQGQRDIPMSPRQREAMLRDGLRGLAATADDNAGQGLWSHYDASAERADLDRLSHGGAFPTRGLFGFDDFVRSSGRADGRDAQIGSVGGGNHFVELQRADELLDPDTARRWGVTRGSLMIMVHSGSVALGHAVGGHFTEEARALFPHDLRHPAHGFYVLPTAGPEAWRAAEYLDAMHNAANFALANRMFLGLMALRSVREVTGRSVSARLVYDAPHNLIFPHGERHLHRKGATPAQGPRDPAGWIGEPVIIPGSMGASSFLLAGGGHEGALCSACHGAGRVLSRGAAIHVDPRLADAALSKLRVVTSVDVDAPAVRLRRDIVARHRQRVLEEAPFAYKAIGPVIHTVEEAGVASGVARLEPLLTVKG